MIMMGESIRHVWVNTLNFITPVLELCFCFLFAIIKIDLKVPSFMSDVIFSFADSGKENSTWVKLWIFDNKIWHLLLTSKACMTPSIRTSGMFML